MDVAELRAALKAAAVPGDAEPMAAYMKGKFSFLGVKSPAVRAIIKPMLAADSRPEGADLIEFVDQCWIEDEREFQYVGCLLLRKWVATLEAHHLDDLRRFVTTKSWWDTVDTLAAHSVGPLVRANRDLAETMDVWIEDDDFWVARTAILHQLTYKGDTDADRLFHYAERRAPDTEFFIRKAIGWALRHYAREAPDEVRAFVVANEDRLSGLSKREALKHL